MAPAFSHEINRHARREREHHQRQTNLAVGNPTDERHGFIHPVATQQEHQVARRKRRVRIAGERRRIFIHQPRENIFAPCKRKHNGQRHRHAAQQAEADRFAALLVQPRFLEQRSHAQRRKQACLRLGQHRKRENRDGDMPFARLRFKQHQHQQQRQHGIDLPPAARSHDERRIQRQQRSHAQRRTLAQPLFGKRKADRRQREIAGNRRKLHPSLEGHASRAETKQPPQQAKQPQHQHIGRRIIAEIACFIEIRRAARGHLACPCAETAHVHAVSLNRERQQYANRQRAQQHSQQTRARIQPLIRQAANQRRRQRQIDDCRADEQRDAHVPGRFGFARVGLFARRGRGQIEHRLADRHGFNLLKAHIGEPRLARVLRAIPAQTHHDRDFLLPLARAAVESQRLPPAIRVVQIAACAVNAGERHVRALRPFAASLGHHARGQLVGRVLADGNRLLKARVVARGIFHQRGGCAVRKRHRFQIGRARARHPHAGLPALGLSVFQNRKIAVCNQVARLRHSILCAAERQRKRDCRDDEQREQNDDPRFLFHLMSLRDKSKHRPPIGERVLDMRQLCAADFDDVKAGLPLRQIVFRHIEQRAFAYSLLFGRRHSLAPVRRAARPHLDLDKDDHPPVLRNQIDLRTGKYRISRKDLVASLHKELLCADFAEYACTI